MTKEYLLAPTPNRPRLPEIVAPPGCLANAGPARDLIGRAWVSQNRQPGDAAPTIALVEPQLSAILKEFWGNYYNKDDAGAFQETENKERLAKHGDGEVVVVTSNGHIGEHKKPTQLV